MEKKRTGESELLSLILNWCRCLIGYSDYIKCRPVDGSASF
jgi:hypothetical protein